MLKRISCIQLLYYCQNIAFHILSVCSIFIIKHVLLKINPYKTMWKFNLLLNNFVLGLWLHVIFFFICVCYFFTRLLPPQFPQEKPVISVYPPIRHHLMDNQGLYVTSPLVSNVCICYSLYQINLPIYYIFIALEI